MVTCHVIAPVSVVFSCELLLVSAKMKREKIFMAIALTMAAMSLLLFLLTRPVEKAPLEDSRTDTVLDKRKEPNQHHQAIQDQEQQPLRRERPFLNKKIAQIENMAAEARKNLFIGPVYIKFVLGALALAALVSMVWAFYLAWKVYLAIRMPSPVQDLSMESQVNQEINEHPIVYTHIIPMFSWTTVTIFFCLLLVMRLLGMDATARFSSPTIQLIVASVATMISLFIGTWQLACLVNATVSVGIYGLITNVAVWFAGMSAVGWLAYALARYRLEMSRRRANKLLDDIPEAKRSEFMEERVGTKQMLVTSIQLFIFFNAMMSLAWIGGERGAVGIAMSLFFLFVNCAPSIVKASWKLQRVRSYYVAPFVFTFAIVCTVLAGVLLTSAFMHYPFWLQYLIAIALLCNTFVLMDRVRRVNNTTYEVFSAEAVTAYLAAIDKNNNNNYH